MEKSKSKNCNNEHTVKVTLNGDKYKIKSGTYVVSDLKHALEVPSDYELEIVKNGEFITLNDNEKITICGKEEFVSHVKCGASS